jgi:hypothetical protein
LGNEFQNIMSKFEPNIGTKSNTFAFLTSHVNGGQRKAYGSICR